MPSKENVKTDTSKEPIQNIGYTPFDEPVVQRSYTKGNIRPDVEMPPLSAPSFISPNLDDFDEQTSSDFQSNGQQGGSSQKSSTNNEPKSTFNPSFNELDKKSKDAGAEMMAELAIDGYAKIRAGIGSLVSMSKNKLDKEFAEGTIDPLLEIPIDGRGTTVSIEEFQEELNRETKNAFILPEEFKEKVLPVLKRIFAKRGIGLTDEQLLLYYVGTDFASVLVLAVKFKRTLDGIYDNMRQQTAMMREQARPRQQPAPETPSEQFREPVRTNQSTRQEFTETGEQDFNQEASEATIIDDENDLIVESAKGFKETPHPKGAPEFGADKGLLDDLQKLAEREARKEEQKKNKPKK